MKIFNSKGMLVIPNPVSKESICKSPNIVIVKECYCPNGHNLISDQAVFNGFDGIVIRVKKGADEGLVALSPVYGYKSRVSLNVDLNDGEIWDVFCPECHKELPVYSRCDCGGQMVVMFSTPEASFTDCIGICNRIGCGHAGIMQSNELMTMSMINELV